MRVECLPATAVPHLTKLYLDYLAKSPSVTKFYAPPDAALSASQYSRERREAVANILLEQNRACGASAETLKNIGRIRNGASAVVTGQQVVLFGGPTYAILKALTAIKKAENATKAGIDCVPIFWLASEDHDLAEVSSVTLLDQSRGLKKFTIQLDAKEGATVGGIRFGTSINTLAKEASDTFADGEKAALLRECYKSGESFSTSFAKLFARLFGDFGLIILDPSDARFHKIAQPLLRAAAGRSEELNVALLARGKELEGNGYHAQVKVTPSSTVLFSLKDGVRSPVHHANGHFSLGKEKLETAELLARIDSRPEDFSGNALFRPLIQDYLLPTLAYVGGPAEVAYFAQSEVLYHELLGRVTPVIARCSATLVDAKVQRQLTKYNLSVRDAFIPPEDLRRTIASRSIPAELSSAFDSTQDKIEKQMAELSEQLKALDPTLDEAAKRAGSKMKYQLSRLKARAGNAEARKNLDVARHAALLSNLLYPNHDLQERNIAGISSIANLCPDLSALYEALDLSCVGHQVIYL